MRGSPSCAVETFRHRQETLDLAASVIDRHCQFSRERPVYTGLKKMKGLAPHPWAMFRTEDV
jgi:hypothetical protein